VKAVINRIDGVRLQVDYGKDETAFVHVAGGCRGSEQGVRMALAPNIFISWSKERGKAAATALHEWLPMIIQAAKPWMSDKDIGKGTVWLDELTAALGTLKQGIICLTRESLSEPWLLYEAGVISKALDRKTRVWTYLLADLKPSDVSHPLGLFQHTVATRDDTFRLLESINNTMEDHGVPSSILRKQFEMLWPELDKKLSELPGPKVWRFPRTRSVEDMVAELLELARAEDRRKISFRLPSDLTVEDLIGEGVSKSQAAAIKAWGGLGKTPIETSKSVPLRDLPLAAAELEKEKKKEKKKK